MVYQKYIQLFKQQSIVTGFSHRIPDYGFSTWIEKLEKALMLSKKNRFLDIGAGNGRFTRLLAEYFAEGVAIEVDFHEDIWKRIVLEAPHVKVYAGFLQNILPLLQGNLFDFVLLVEVFEHIPLSDVDTFLKALYAVVADDGIVFLTTPNFVVQGPAEESPEWHGRFLYGHHKHYKVQELQILFKNAGFSVIYTGFEGYQKKVERYNKQYYPCTRIDYALMNSKKLPIVLRRVYTMVTALFMPIVRGYFKLLAMIYNRYEKKRSSEETAGTIVLILQKMKGQQ